MSNKTYYVHVPDKNHQMLLILISFYQSTIQNQRTLISNTYECKVQNKEPLSLSSMYILFFAFCFALLTKQYSTFI